MVWNEISYQTCLIWQQFTSFFRKTCLFINFDKTKHHLLERNELECSTVCLSSFGLLALPPVYPTASHPSRKRRLVLLKYPMKSWIPVTLTAYFCRVISRNNDGLDEIDNLILTPWLDNLANSKITFSRN